MANEAGRSTARSSGNRPTPTRADSFSLSGPSNPPDPQFHAYRRDLADVSLAGQVIASHYAAPVERTVAAESPLLAEARADSDPVMQVEAGSVFRLLDDTLGWAWGYAGEEGRVGYLRSDVLA